MSMCSAHLPPSRALRWLREAGSSPPGHRNGAWGALCGVRPGDCGVTLPVVDTVASLVDGPGRPRHSGCMIEAQVAPNATYQSAERMLALLKSFDDTRVEQGVAEIARALGVHKSTASRLAAALERTG